MTSHRSAIEPLEARIAPANLLNARTLIFTDVDGDEVKIVFSKDVFLGTDTVQLAKANEVFKFDNGDVAHEVVTQQQLRLIDFTKFATVLGVGSIANGVSVTVTATQKDGGDGFADIGAIKATGISVGKVSIDGDLGQIDAGGPSLKVGLAGLTVASLGKRGTATQIPVPTPTADNPAPDLVSTITGELTTLTVLGDVKEARVRVVDGKSGSTVTSAAKLGSLTIGGSLIGRTAVEAASDDTGVIECDRGIGAIKIGTTVTQGIVGGGGKTSGRISAGGGIASVTISGDIAGGAGANSGMIAAVGSLGPVSIAGDLVGGAGESSGLIRTYGNMTSLTIGDDIVAGTGVESAHVSALGAISKLVIKGDVDATTASAGANSASIFANGLPQASVNGNVLGGAGAGSGVIESGRNIGVFTAATLTAPEVATGLTVVGNVVGGAGDGSGAILAAGAVKLVTLKGDLTGGLGKQSGVLRSGLDLLKSGEMRAVTIKGSIEGGAGDSSGAILAGGSLGTLALGSATAPAADVLKGGGGVFSGSVSAHGKISTVKITGNVLGGEGAQSGAVLCYERSAAEGDLPGNIGTLTVSGNFTGGAGDKSGRISADGALTALTVASWTGGTGIGSASLATGLGILGSGNAGSIRILGDLTLAATSPGLGSVDFAIGGKLKSFFVGDDTTGAAIRVAEDAATLNFIGDVVGSKVTAHGKAVPTATADLAIGKLSVGGNVSTTSFLAGYDLSGAGVNPDAQIGAVKVRGNWVDSNLVAGVIEGTDAGFGNDLDVKAPGADAAGIISKIASVLIGGSVANATSGHFGFVAQAVGKMKVGTTTYALTSTGGQFFDIADGVSIREVALV